MSYFGTAIDYLRSIVLSKSQRWNHAQHKESYYWRTTPPYFMPWLDRLNRFGYQLGDSRQYQGYVDCLPLSAVVSRFEFITLPPRPVVVDLGCGPSGIGYSLSHEGRTYCIDPLLEEYRRITGYEQNIFQRLGDNKTLVCAGGESVSVPEAADLVFCINVLDHTKDPSAVLLNSARLLKEDRHLFLMVDGYSKWSPVIIDPLHPHQFTAGTLRTLIERAGFEVVHFQEAYCIHGGRIQLLLVWLQNLVRRTKTEFCEFFVIARKQRIGEVPDLPEVSAAH